MSTGATYRLQAESRRSRSPGIHTHRERVRSRHESDRLRHGISRLSLAEQHCSIVSARPHSLQRDQRIGQPCASFSLRLESIRELPVESCRLRTWQQAVVGYAERLMVCGVVRAQCTRSPFTFAVARRQLLREVDQIGSIDTHAANSMIFPAGMYDARGRQPNVISSGNGSSNFSVNASAIEKLRLAHWLDD